MLIVVGVAYYDLSVSVYSFFPLDCNSLSVECIDCAAAQFKLLDNLLTSYNISAIISHESKTILILYRAYACKNDRFFGGLGFSVVIVNHNH